MDRGIIGFRNTYLLNSNIFYPVMPNTGLKNTWIPGYPLARYSQMLFAQGTLILLASSGFRRQKEIIHVCFLCNKHILAVVIIVLITLNHVSFLHYASKVPVLGKWAEKVARLTGKSTCYLFRPGNIIWIKFLVWGGCLSNIFLSSVKGCIRKGACRLNGYYNE